MAQDFDTLSQNLLDLDRKITQEIDKATNELRLLKDGNGSSYINFHRLNHINNLFDEASEVIKDLRDNKSSINKVEVFEAKRHINENFGVFQYIQKEINSIYKENNKEEKILEIVTDEAKVLTEDTLILSESEIDEMEYEEDYDFEAEEIEIKAKERKDKKEKAKKEKERQTRLRNERQAREESYRIQDNQKSYIDSSYEQQNQVSYRFINDFENNERFSEQQRQEEAYRQGMRVTEDRPVTATELQREQYKQYEEEQANREKAEALRRQEQETFEKYRKREEEISNYESFGKEHIDFSSEYQKDRERQRDNESESYPDQRYSDFSSNEQTFQKSKEYTGYSDYKDSVQPTSYEDYRCYSYAPPTGNNGDYSVYENRYERYDNKKLYENDKYISNSEIYKAIENQTKTARESGTAVTVSAVYTDMLKRNVDAAHDYWREVRGTPEEKNAIQEYKEQRKYLDNVKRDIYNNVYIIEGEKYTPVNHNIYERKERNNQNNLFSSYVPGGTISEPASTSNSTAGVYTKNNRETPRDNFLYTPENPMVVSREYRDAIYKRAQDSQDIFNKLVDYGKTSKTGPLKISDSTAYEMALAMDAYKGFHNAQKAGVVVVSDNAVIKSPDFNLWQQRKDIKYDIDSKYAVNKINIGNDISIPQQPKSFFNYTADNPMVVSAQYRDAVYKKGIEAEKILSKQSNSFGKQENINAHGKLTPETKMAVDAYYGFRKAQQSGVVVVSENSKLNSPDLKLWQKFNDGGYGPDKKEFNPHQTHKNIEPTEGSQGAFKFFNRKASGLQDSPHFSHKKLYDAHFKSIYGHTERYATRAGRLLGRKVYSTLQDGENNALRTFEQGRYYISTGVVFTNAVVHSRIINSDKATKLADRSKIALGDKVKSDVKLKNYQTTNELRAKIYKELENEKFMGVTKKQIGAKVDELTFLHKQRVEKKFGEMAKFSDTKLTNEIEKLKLRGINTKLRIKELESLGAKITPVQRKQLMELKKLHEANSIKLRKLFGLQKERNTMDLTLGILRDSSNKISKNMRAYTNGLYALRNFISKPFQNGDVYAANGLYNAATFVANRHTRMIIKKSVRASMWLSGKTLDAAYLITGNDPMMWRTAVNTVKLNAKVKVDVAKKTIKTAQVDARRKTIKTAREGSKFVGNKIADYTPTRIRTSVKSGWNGLVSTKRKIDMITGSIRERYQRSIVNRGISAVRTWVDRTAKSLKLFFSTASKILTKAILAFGGVFLALVLIVCIMGAFMSASSAGGSILSPYDSEEEEEKINLAPYMRLLNAEQSDFDTTLNETLQTKVYRGKKYDKVTINYATSLRSNHKEMLSMMAVRFKQDISLEDNLAVRLYLKSLYHDSHTLAAKESEPYSCSGCKTKTITHNPGCEEYTEYCEGVLELRKCTNKNEEGECKGHKKYTCPSHEETYCPGEHVDLTLTVSVLGFDEIFTADSMANAGANVQAGGLIGNATITYYCAEKYPHICNAGPPYLTASGTTPTPNRTIAVDPKKIPLGTHVVIFGQEYVAEDTGGAVDGMHIDILVETHAEALAKGTRYNVPVYSVSIEGDGGEDAEEWEGWTQDNIEWAKVIYSPNWSDIYSGVNDYGNGNIEIGNLVVAGDWVWPVTATTASSGFGWRDDPMNPGNPDFHKGTDIAIPEGTPVHAAGDGTVAASNFSSSAGNMIIINHADGVVTKYFHNSQLLVSVGDKVKAGQVIAYSGNTGNSTGPHLHFEFWVNGKVMDPRLQYGL